MTHGDESYTEMSVVYCTIPWGRTSCIEPDGDGGYQEEEMTDAWSSRVGARPIV